MANYPYDEIGTQLDRTFVAKINKNFDEVEGDIRNLVEVVGPILDESFESAALTAEFEERFNEEISRIQPDWVEFKESTTAQLAQIMLNVTTIGIDPTGQADIVPILVNNFQNNVNYLFPAGDYLIDSYALISNHENVTLTFSAGARLMDSFGVEVELVNGDISRVPHGIRFEDCYNITIAHAPIYNPRGYNGEIAKNDWSKRVPNIDLRNCRKVTIEVLLDGYTGPYVTGVYELGAEHMMRASFVRMVNCSNIDLQGTLASDSGRGEIFSLYQCSDIRVHDLAHRQGDGATFWSLGKFIDCKNVVFRDIVDIESNSEGSLFDVSGSNIDFDNVNPTGYNGYLFDATKEWGMDGGNTDRIHIRNVKNNKGIINTHLPGADSTNEYKNQIDRDLTIDNLHVSNSVIENYTAASPFDVRHVLNSYLDDVVLNNVARVTYMEKVAPMAPYLNNIYINRMTLNNAITTKIEAYGYTEVSDSYINTNGQELDLVDRQPNNGMLHESSSLIRFKNTRFENVVFDISSNVELVDCEFENCRFAANGLTGKYPNLSLIRHKYKVSHEDSVTADQSLLYFRYIGINVLTLDGGEILGTHENTLAKPLIDRRDINEIHILNNSKIDVKRYENGALMINQLNTLLAVSNGDKLYLNIDSSSIVGVGLTLALSYVTSAVTRIRLNNTKFSKLDSSTAKTLFTTGSGNFNNTKLMITRCDFEDEPIDAIAAEITTNGGEYTGNFNTINNWSI